MGVILLVIYCCQGIKLQQHVCSKDVKEHFKTPKFFNGTIPALFVYIHPFHHSITNLQSRRCCGWIQTRGRRMEGAYGSNVLRPHRRDILKNNFHRPFIF